MGKDNLLRVMLNNRVFAQVDTLFTVKSLPDFSQGTGL